MMYLEIRGGCFFTEDEGLVGRRGGVFNYFMRHSFVRGFRGGRA